MSKEQIKQDILEKIRRIASETGEAPGQIKFANLTGIKEHAWRGKYWRGWTEALADAGFSAKAWQVSYDETDLLLKVADLTSKLRRFPSQVDFQLEAANGQDFPSVQTIKRRWNMAELAIAVAGYCDTVGRQQDADFARSYASSRPTTPAKDDDDEAAAGTALGHVYMQRHGTDYKIGFTKSLNKRGRQIQIELPQEIELVHSILTDDPAGVEGYWHRRFADRRTRGEWFKLTKADVAAFKKWSKIW
jgi:hypothetical protein